MKTLFIVRHGASADAEWDKSDKERPLTAKGREDAKNMAGKLIDFGQSPTIMVSSSALRALQTARIFADKIHYVAEKIVADEKIYVGPDNSPVLFSQITDYGREHASMIVFGHNPRFSNLLKFLDPGYTGSLSPCTVVGIQFSNTEWAAIGQGDGKIIFHESPKKNT